jgi:putative serine protease PepD
VPIDRFRDEWESLAKGQDFNSLTPAWAMLGVQVAEVAKELRIRSIAPRGAAEKAGLERDDVLLKLGDRELHQKEDLTASIRQHGSGDKVEVAFRRRAETLKHQITLGRNSPGQNP